MNTRFEIRDHRLSFLDGSRLSYKRSPNQGEMIAPDYLVMHYTAGSSADSSISWLRNRRSEASAHLVIGRDGEITQLVDFNRTAWHAGASRWDGLSGMNQYSIGIELDNAGKLSYRAGRWYSWFERTYPEEEVVQATHKNETQPAGWHAYTPVQLEVAFSICHALFQHYHLLELVGHDDIAPERKIDPGPAFPMRSFRARLMGRKEEKEEVFATTEDLILYQEAHPVTGRRTSLLLPKGTKVSLLKMQSYWKFVEVDDPVEGEGQGVQGWLNGRYLARIE